MANVTGNQLIAQILKKEGTDYLFCFPNNPLIEACAAESIRPIVTRTERTLVNMADGYTRVHNARRIGVCAVQQGPGAENAFGGVAQATSDSTPVLVFTGGPVAERRGVPYSFSTVDNYRLIAKWADEINQAERIPAILRRAYSALHNGRRGPVMLEVPGDVGRASLPASLLDTYVAPRAHRFMADPDDVEAAATLLLEAEYPLIYAGQGVLYAEASDELQALAELLGVAVMTTTNGKSAFSERHPLALGAAGYTGTEAAATFMDRATVVLAAGTSISRQNFSHPVPPGKQLIHLTTDERDLYKDYPATVGLVGDAKLVLGQLHAAVKARLAKGTVARSGDAVAAEIAGIKRAWLERWHPRLTSDEAPISPYRVIAEIMRRIDPAKSIITHDSGNPRDQLLPFYESVTPRGYLGWGKSTQLGYGYGLALGAKLAAPEKLVVNFMGDAAFGMVGMDVETASRARIGLLTIIINNSAMGGYEKYLPVATERYQTKFLTGNYALVAAGLGAYSERVERADDIGAAIDRARKATEENRPSVVEIITREEPSFSKYWE